MKYLSIAALICISCVTVGPGDKYTVDAYGAPVEAKTSLNRRPTKDELDPDGGRRMKQMYQMDDMPNNTPIHRIKI